LGKIWAAACLERSTKDPVNCEVWDFKPHELLQLWVLSSTYMRVLWWS